MELEELGKRATACKGWKWIPGMLAFPTAGCTPVPVRLTDDRRPIYPDEYAWPHDMGLRFPDLTDPATIGCLLQLVRDAWGDSEAHLALGAAGWVLMSGESRVANVVYSSPVGKTEAEAPVAALEAAPSCEEGRKP